MAQVQARVNAAKLEGGGFEFQNNIGVSHEWRLV
jgi:hypothetical protein